MLEAAGMRAIAFDQSIAQSRRLVEGKFNTRQYVGSGAKHTVRRMKES
jgi:hypothetical protein